MNKKELTNKIEMAMVRGNVAKLTSDVKVIAISKPSGTKRFTTIDVAIIDYELTMMVIRITLYDDGEFRLHNVYNVDAYLSSYKLECIENAIHELNYMDWEITL